MQFICKTCEKSFNTDISLRKHNQSEHSKKRDWLWKQSKLKAQIFKQKSSLYKNIFSLKQKEQHWKKVNCRESCKINHEKYNWIASRSDKFYDIMYQYEIHSDFDEFDSSEKNFHLCDICGKLLKTNSNFISHVNNNHTKNNHKNQEQELSDDQSSSVINNQLHICDMCEQMFLTNSNLQSHVNRELREKYSEFLIQ